MLGAIFENVTAPPMRYNNYYFCIKDNGVMYIRGSCKSIIHTRNVYHYHLLLRRFRQKDRLRCIQSLAWN